MIEQFEAPFIYGDITELDADLRREDAQRYFFCRNNGTEVCLCTPESIGLCLICDNYRHVFEPKTLSR